MDAVLLSSRNSRAVLLSNALLLTIAILAFVVPGLEIGGFNIFAYVIYLIPHTGLLLYFMMTKREFALDFPYPLYGLLLFSIYVVCSFFWATDTTIAAKKMVIIVTSIGVAMHLYWSIANYRTLDWYLRIIQIVSIIGLIVAAFEVATGAHLPVSNGYESDTFHMSTAWYPNVNDFSFFLATVAFLFLIRALPVRQSRSTLLGILGYVGCVTVIFLNGSRAALLSVLTVTTLLLVLYGGKGTISDSLNDGMEWPIFMPLLLIGSLAMVAVFSLVPNIFEPYGNRSFWFRWQSHRASVIFLFRTGIGVGVGNFPVELSLSSIPPAAPINTHSWFATLLGEYGWIGTGLFLLAYGRTLDKLLFQFIRDGDTVALGLLGALLSFVLAGLGPNDVLVFQIHWIVWALAIGAIYRVPDS
jgi:hypothetical protein